MFVNFQNTVCEFSLKLGTFLEYTMKRLIFCMNLVPVCGVIEKL